MNPGLKKIVFKKLNQDLSSAEIILAENKSIWFIDRVNKYWYFELEKSGKLWWRYEFFTDFFILFCLEVNEFQPLLSEWVEGVLNCGVNTTKWCASSDVKTVEGVLNCRVNITLPTQFGWDGSVEMGNGWSGVRESVLNHKITSISLTSENSITQQVLVNDLLFKIESSTPLNTPASDSVDEVLSYKVTRAIPDLSESLTEVENLLNQ